MDDGRPFRQSQGAPRRVVSRPQEQVKRQPDSPPPVKSEPEAKVPPKVEKEKPTPTGRGWKIAFIVACVALLLVFTWATLFSGGSDKTAIDDSKYQAVFFENGNVYFGKLTDFSNDYYKMSGVYYPQTQTGVAAESEEGDQSSITLLKLGDAIHGPEDEMMIAKSRVQFYQNLQSDSRVAQLIDEQE